MTTTSGVQPAAEHVAKVHEAERVVDEIAAARERLRQQAHETMGIMSDGSRPPPLREVFRTRGVSAYPVIALGTLAIVDSFQAYGLAVLTPEISRSLGISLVTIALLGSLKTLALSLSPLPIAALVQRHPRRALICIITALLWAITTLYTGFATSALFLGLVLVIDGLTTGSVAALHPPLLLDSYPPPARVRVLSVYRSFDSFGNVLAPLLVALLAGVLGFTWRGVFVVLGVICLAAVPLTLRLRDPGFGEWDTERLRRAVHDKGEHLRAEDVSLGFFEIVRRLVLIPTVRKLLVAHAVLGILVIPYQTFLSFYLDRTLDFGPGERGLFFAFTAACSMGALAAFGRHGESLFRKDPNLLVQRSALYLAIGVILIACALASPYTPLALLLFGASSAIIVVLSPALGIALLSVVPARMRPHSSALYGIFYGGVGGMAGAVLLGGVGNRYGVGMALVSLLVPGLLGALLVSRAGRGVQADLDRMIDEVLEDEQIKLLTASGAHLPMLSCRHIDFSYGQIQVLFDVDFTVDDGEMVALLGTNGAGKSTLLRVISGIGLPERGTIHYRGQDITYLDAERRVRLGITQVPGGRAVFGPLTVIENLRSFGYSLGKDRNKLDALIDECLETFPRLAERRNGLAAQLSGGEQQMLGLSKALIMRPRVLVIDELSLGLAPIVVRQLLELVRRINATGTAVVLVEQSVNIALNLVEHAYFMEKGEMRFDGVAADLLGRDDLLRAVFLRGAEAVQ